MALNMVLLGSDGSDAATPSNRGIRIFGCVASAFVAGVMIGAAITKASDSSPLVSEMGTDASGAVALFASTSPFRSRLGAPRIGAFSKTYGIASNPLAKLAISAIEANDRGNQERGVSMKAQSELVSGWSLVDQGTKDKLLRVIDDVKFKANAVAGVSAPMNFFDPLGFSTTVTAGKLLFYREVELKHGRIAMLAALGIVVGEKFHPLFGGNVDVPSAFAFQQTPLETFWPAVVAAIAIPEVFSVLSFQDPSKGELWAIKEDHEPGNLGFDPLGLRPKDDKAFADMQTKEINNGRLAMIAAAGMIAQELATGQKLF